jgi:hypothetical protein
MHLMCFNLRFAPASKWRTAQLRRPRSMQDDVARMDQRWHEDHHFIVMLLLRVSVGLHRRCASVVILYVSVPQCGCRFASFPSSFDHCISGKTCF